MSEIPTFSPSMFYGASSVRIKSSSCVDKSKKSHHTVIPYIPRNLLYGPNISWKVFPKQDQALELMKHCKEDVMCFAFEHFGSGRLFLVAHPEVFWHYDRQRNPDRRCTYEIITEFTACKLYIDLEFDINVNNHSDGYKMVDTFIKLTCFYLKLCWNIFCDRRHIINLDSTTSTKFSRHLIFCLPDVCFANNYQVGYFVRYVCQIVKETTENNKLPDLMDNEFNLQDIKNLLVVSAKGNSKMFCDEGVYTKNRHFRLLGSTKKGKNSNLILSQDNEYKAESELELFLHSLITFISSSDVKVLEFNYSTIEKKYHPRQSLPLKEATPSPYPLIDKFITDLVSPGKIYRSTYFSSKKIILYDIIGYRFCGNIGRQHKSNNVKYIVDLSGCIYYQKCYDYECSDYRSEKTSLPCDIVFKMTDNSDIYGSDNQHGLFGLSPSDTDQVLDTLEAVGCDSTANEEKLQKFPSFGLSDEEFFNVEY